MPSDHAPSLLDRLAAHVTPRQLDWLVLVATLVMAAPALAHASGRGGVLAGLAVVPFATAPLLWRRSRPGWALLVLVAALAAEVAIGRAAPSGVGVLFGLYAAARYGEERVRALSGAAVAVAAAAAFGILLATGGGRISPHLSVAGIFAAASAWILGEATRTRRAYLDELERHAARLAREREADALRAADAERARIARELHDVVTHEVSVIAVQAGAGRTAARRRPERALEALGVIERTARHTLVELRTLLGVLRAGEEASPRAPLRPRPSLAQLDELAASVRAAGVAVEVRRSGSPAPLDPLTELSAYRVLQEALTNVVKHAPGSAATASVQCSGGELQVTVTDDGRGAAPGERGGHGLVGMRERVALCGGELEAGPIAAGGFRVSARFPLAAEAPEGGGSGDAGGGAAAAPASAEPPVSAAP